MADVTSGAPQLHIPLKNMKVTSIVMTTRIWDNRIKGQEYAEDEDIASLQYRTQVLKDHK